MIILLLLLAFYDNESEIFEEAIRLPKGYIAPEVFDDLTKTPLNINTADYDELISLPYITPIAAKAILDYRQTNGKFKNLNELLLIKEISEDCLEKIKPFLTVKGETTRPKTMFRIRAKCDSLIFPSNYQEWTLTNRIGADYGKFRLVFLTDKDQKESNLFDFWTGSIAYTSENNQIIVGSYYLAFGQGLIMAEPFQNFTTAKSFGGLKNKPLNQLTTPLENNALNGLAYQKTLSNFQLTGYLSRNWLDAEIDSAGIVQRIDYDGRHIDSLTKANKDRLREDLLGIRCEYRSAKWQLGWSGCRNHYNHRFVPTDSTNSFFGDQLTILGVDGTGILGNYYCQGEWAYSLKYGFGFAFGLVGDWQKIKVGLNLVYQQKDFYSPHSYSYSLLAKKDRLGGNFNFQYHFSRSQVFFRGATKINIIGDSLPAKIETGLKRKEGNWDIALSYKRTLKNDIGKSEGTKLDLGYDLTKRVYLGFRLEDRYLIAKPKRGILLGLSSDFSFGGFVYKSRIYWFEIIKPDCPIFVYEPGFSGLANNHTFMKRGVRFYSFWGYNRKPFRIGLRIGVTRIEQINLDWATQMELSQ